MNQKRQPKGTRNGGQFAGSVNPEPTLTLLAEQTNDAVEASPSVFTIADRESIIKRTEREIEEIYEAKEDRADGGGDTLDQLIEEGEELVSLKSSINHHQERIIAEQKRQLEQFRASGDSFDPEALREGSSSFDLEAALTERVMSSIEFDAGAEATEDDANRVEQLVRHYFANDMSRIFDNGLGQLLDREADVFMQSQKTKLAEIVGDNEESRV